MTLLRVQNLSKSFGKNFAVQDVNFTLNEGECGALLGPNGAGKSTTLKMLTGILTPSQGEIMFYGKKRGDFRHLIGYLPQEPKMHNWMTGREALRFMGQLSHMEKSDLDDRVEELLSLVGIKEAANRHVSTYSGGMKQRLGIAQAIIHRPKLVIMDEPVSALDPIGRREMLDLLKSIKQETTILFSTHILHDVKELSDRVFIINQGQVVVNSTFNQLIADHQQPIFFIEAERNIDQWTKSLQSKSETIEATEALGNQARISVNDIAKARKELLMMIERDGIPLQRFEIMQTTLEEIFLKMVKQ